MKRSLVLALALAALVPGCGGGDAPDAAQARKAYIARVAEISTRTGARLSALSGRSDYRQAAAAARSTRQYATAIRQAAGQLRGAAPPRAVAELHGSLVRLYAQTAVALDALAARFAQARDPVELAARAQELSTEVQRYASKEQQLRAAIEQALAAATTP